MPSSYPRQPQLQLKHRERKTLPQGNQQLMLWYRKLHEMEFVKKDSVRKPLAKDYIDTQIAKEPAI